MTEALYPPHAAPPAARFSLPRALFEMAHNPLRILPASIYREPIVQGRDLGIDYVFISDPKLIGQVLLDEADLFDKSDLERNIVSASNGNGLVTSQHASWRWQRRATAPVFRRSEIEACGPAMAVCATELVDRWRSEMPRHEGAYDIEPDITRLTLDILNSTLLSGCTEAEAAAVRNAQKIAARHLHWDIACRLLRLPPSFWYPYKSRLRRSADEMRSALMGLIARRRAGSVGHAGTDILSRLLSATDSEGIRMSDELVCDNLVEFIDAAQQTTALALSWTLYLLARAPRWQELLRDETLKAAPDTSVHGLDSGQLKYTSMVVKESMRLYPPIPTIVRIASRDAAVGGKLLPKGTIVFLMVYATHRHEALWSDPQKFDPFRFTDENEAQFVRGQYIPFGFGQRTCIGMGFANQAIAIVLATILRRMQISWDGVHEPEPINLINLNPRGGMRLLLSER